ncbi:preprotein translocase subunit SecE [Actinomyces qiguomingii]|uniref:preprotein translocase subunit SecE n=1 Tax=Actinomyces qiguomingii TaxID=2057800 RepID=UPI000CA003C5|nr:preprotein translocase subunit SecE [Actinomyces qiguomingii]
MSDTSVAKGAREKRRGPISRVSLYFRQVVDELRKVVWPTWSELWTYFAVVVVFILAIMLFTGVLDGILDRLVMWVFA